MGRWYSYSHIAPILEIQVFFSDYCYVVSRCAICFAENSHRVVLDRGGTLALPSTDEDGGDDATVVLKDQNFLGTPINMGDIHRWWQINSSFDDVSCSTRKPFRFRVQISRDVEFLRRHGVMDYSLLLGIQPRPQDALTATPHPQSRSQSLVHFDEAGKRYYNNETICFYLSTLSYPREMSGIPSVLVWTPPRRASQRPDSTPSVSTTRTTTWESSMILHIRRYRLCTVIA